VDVTVTGDARMSLELILPNIEHRDRKEWFTQINGWKKRFPFKYFDDSDKAKPQFVIEEINRQTRGEAIITTGVGQHQMWAAQFYRWRFPGRWSPAAASARWATASPAPWAHRSVPPAKPSSISTAMPAIS